MIQEDDQVSFFHDLKFLFLYLRIFFLHLDFVFLSSPSTTRLHGGRAELLRTEIVPVFFFLHLSSLLSELFLVPKVCVPMIFFGELFGVLFFVNFFVNFFGELFGELFWGTFLVNFLVNFFGELFLELFW